MQIITQIRDYHAKGTISNIHANNKFICYALEDIGRPVGVKFPGETCIPEGCYEAHISRSERFQRDMILLTTPDSHVVQRHGVIFSGLRVHGGNTVAHTDGCVLVGDNCNIQECKIWNCKDAEARLREIVKSAENGCYWVITSK